MSKSKIVSFIFVLSTLLLVAFISNQRSSTAAPPDNSMAGGVPDSIRALEQRVAALESRPSGAINYETGRITASFSSGQPTITITFSKTFTKKPFLLLEQVPPSYSVNIISVTNTQATIQVFRSSNPDPVEIGYVAIEF